MSKGEEEEAEREELEELYSKKLEKATSPAAVEMNPLSGLFSRRKTT